MKTLRWGLRLIIIQVYFIILVWLGSYFYGLDVVLSLIYLYMVWGAGQIIKAENGPSPLIKILIIGLTSQLPGIALAALNIFYSLGIKWVAADFTYAFQLWHTPFVPLLSFWTFPVYQDYNFYYAALYFMSPLYLAVLLMPYTIEILKRRRHTKFTTRTMNSD